MLFRAIFSQYYKAEELLVKRVKVRRYWSSLKYSVSVRKPSYRSIYFHINQKKPKEPKDQKKCGR